MDTVQPYTGEAILDLPVSRDNRSIRTKESTQYFGSEKDYKKTKKYLIWFTLSSLVVSISIGIFVF